MGVTSGRVETNKVSKTIFYVNWQQVEQSTANNQTKINWQAGINTGSSTSHDDFYSNAVKIYKVEINGEMASNGGTWSQIHVGNDYQLLSGTAVIPHNNDGSKTFNISITAWTFSSSNYSGSQDFTLNNIARQATADSVPDFTDENNPVLYYTNNAGNAVTTLQACIALTESSAQDNPAIPYRDISKTGNSYTFNLSDAERDTLRNATSGQNRNFWFFIKTVLNGTTYYSYKLGKMTIVNGEPFIDTITYSDINSTTTDLTNNDQIIIQGMSRLQFQFYDVESQKGATLASLSININGNITTVPFVGTSIVSTTYNYNEVDVAENTTAILTLTDSRGFSSSYSVPITIWEYYTPTAIITEYRESNFYTESKIKVDADYANLGGLNTIAIKYRIKKSTEDDTHWGNWTTITDNVEASFNADNLYAWDIEVYLEDALEGFNDYVLHNALDVGIPLVFYDVKRRSVGVNTLPANNTSFEVTGTVEIDGSENVTGTVDITGGLVLNTKDLDTVLLPYTLYDNANGTTGTVTLSQSAADFQYLEIYYANTQNYITRHGFEKVANPNGKSFMCYCSWIYNTNGSTQTITEVNTISGTSITRGESSGWKVDANGSCWAGAYGTRSFYITKVVGYK